MATAAIGNGALRKMVNLVGEVVCNNARPVAEELPALVETSAGFLTSPAIVWSADCEKEDKKQSKKLGPICRSPDLTKKPVPPYVYGYCKEPEPELPMSCPPKTSKKKKGPCCLNEAKNTKGGCKQ